MSKVIVKKMRRNKTDKYLSALKIYTKKYFYDLGIDPTREDLINAKPKSLCMMHYSQLCERFNKRR